MFVIGLIVIGGVCYDDYDIFGGKIMFVVNGVYIFNVGVIIFCVSYSEGFKVLLFYQLFGDFGNEMFLFESLCGWEVGVMQKFVDGCMELGVIWFQCNISNLVDFINCLFNGMGICVQWFNGMYDNVVCVRVKGFEVIVMLCLIDVFIVQGVYSWVKSIDCSIGFDFVCCFCYSVSLFVDYVWGFGFLMGMIVIQVSGSWSLLGEVCWFEGYVLVDLCVVLLVGDYVELFGWVENLFDECYQIVVDYVILGCVVYVGVWFKF